MDQKLGYVKNICCENNSPKQVFPGVRKVLMVATLQCHIAQFHKPIIKCLHESGYKVDVAARNNLDSKPGLHLDMQGDVYNIPFSRSPFRLSNIIAYRDLKRIINTGEYDVVHCNTPVGGILARISAKDRRRQGKMKVIYEAHGFHFFKGAPLKNWLLYYPVEKICSYFTDVLITINQEDYQLARKRLKALRVEFVPGVGVDVDKFRNAQVNRKQKREVLGIPENATLLLSVGELNKNKNQQVIIRALAKLENSSIHYGIAGSGCEEHNLKKLALELNVSDRVHFWGYRNDIAELCKTADIFCFPSCREGLGLAAVEAMAAGLPVIAADNRGTREYMKHGETGFVCRCNDAAAFADAVNRLHNDPNLRQKIGKNNQYRAESFDVKNVISQMEKIYGAVCGK